MTTTDTCPGCARKFAPGGFSKHLQYSRDPRCASARDHLRPTYPNTPNQEPPRSSTAIDVEMVDLGDTEPITLSGQSDQDNMDTDSSDHMGGCVDNEYPQPAFDEAPDVFVQPSDTHASVIFDSDMEDSDDDGDQDRTHTGPETPSTSMNANTEQASQTGGSLYFVPQS